MTPLSVDFVAQNYFLVRIANDSEDEMKLLICALAILTFGMTEQIQKRNSSSLFVDYANDGLEATDRLFEIQMEPKSIFIPARLEAERYIAKAERLANSESENQAYNALQGYYAELQLCRISTEATGKPLDSCRGGKADEYRIKAYRAINSR